MTAAPEPGEVLAWDTEHWGVVTARAAPGPLDADRTRALDAWSGRTQVGFLMYLCPGDDAGSLVAAQQAGFVVVDVRTELTVAAGPRARPGLRLATDADRQWLEGLAAVSHLNSRFGVDPHLPDDRVAALYRRWISRDLDRGPGVLVAERDGRPAGYLSTSLDGGQGAISLVAVERCWQGQGVGAELVAASVDLLVAEGASQVDVVTQATNVGAVRCYERAGFVTERASYYLHKWYQR